VSIGPDGSRPWNHGTFHGPLRHGLQRGKTVNVECPGHNVAALRPLSAQPPPDHRTVPWFHSGPDLAPAAGSCCARSAPTTDASQCHRVHLDTRAAHTGSGPGPARQRMGCAHPGADLGPRLDGLSVFAPHAFRTPKPRSLPPTSDGARHNEAMARTCDCHRCRLETIRDLEAAAGIGGDPCNCPDCAWGRLSLGERSGRSMSSGRGCPPPALRRRLMACLLQARLGAGVGARPMKGP
jgi:hypothetical protein